VLTLAFAWWYRSSNARATYRPDWSYSGHIALVGGSLWIIANLNANMMPASAIMEMQR
jgi:cytochrome o ubiquinol oxidase subunit 2